MRPVTRGASPFPADTPNFSRAKVPLLALWGHYCCYCERYIATSLAVEHVRSFERRPDLVGRWVNYLLACSNCNSTKGIQRVDLDRLLMPDRDNTFHAFTYNQNGSVEPSSKLDATQRALAQETLRLLGFDRRGRRVTKNGKLVIRDRRDDREEAYGRIAQFVIDLIANDTPHEREKILWQAKTIGLFSLWMTLFRDVAMRQDFITLFNAATDCFDPITTDPISPRPRNPDLDPSGRT